MDDKTGFPRGHGLIYRKKVAQSDLFHGFCDMPLRDDGNLIYTIIK